MFPDKPADIEESCPQLSNNLAVTEEPGAMEEPLTKAYAERRLRGSGEENGQIHLVPYVAAYFSSP